MKRVLLLTDSQPDLQTQRVLEQITVGLSGDYEFLHEPSAGRGLLASGGRLVRLRHANAAADVVHAWGHRALRLASVISAKPILYTPLPDDPASAIRWLRSAMLHRNIRVISLTGADDRFCVEGGVAAEACALVRPGIRISRQLGRDDALRVRLGIRKEAKICLLVGESHEYADHAMALHALALLASIKPECGILFLGMGGQAEAVEELHSMSWPDKMLINARRVLGDGVNFEDLIPAADVGVISAPDRLAILPVLACMAAGLPMVAPATRPVSELLEDRHTALLYSPRTPRALAQRVLMLLEHAEMAHQISDESRAEAYKLYSVSRFLDEMRRVYP